MSDGKEVVEALVELAKDIPEIEERLDDVDMGLLDEASVQVAAGQRYTVVVQYQQLYNKSSVLRLNISANLGVGNKEVAKRYEEEVKITDTDMAFLRRFVKFIDKSHPGAKARMDELSKRPPACPKCGSPI